MLVVKLFLQRTPQVLAAIFALTLSGSLSAAPILFSDFTEVDPVDIVVSADGTSALMNEGSFIFVELYNDDLFTSAGAGVDPSAADNVLSFDFDFSSASPSGCTPDLLFGDCDVATFRLYDQDFSVIDEINLFASASGSISFAIAPSSFTTSLGLSFLLEDFDFDIGSTLELLNLALGPADDSSTPVPEPGTLLLLLTGLAGLTGLRKAKVRI